MRETRGRRGFALIIVVLIVALLSVVAVTLLDLVKVDLTITGQNRKNFEARTVTDGALFEIWRDSRTVYPDSPPWKSIVANPNDLLNTGAPLGSPGIVGAGCGVPGSPCVTSAFYRGATNDQPSQDYGAEVCWKSTGPTLNSDVGTTMAIAYQIRVVGEVNNGESTAEERATVYQPVAFQNGQFIPREHCH